VDRSRLALAVDNSVEGDAGAGTSDASDDAGGDGVGVLGALDLSELKLVDPHLFHFTLDP